MESPTAESARSARSFSPPHARQRHELEYVGDVGPLLLAPRRITAAQPGWASECPSGLSRVAFVALSSGIFFIVRTGCA